MKGSERKSRERERRPFDVHGICVERITCLTFPFTEKLFTKKHEWISIKGDEGTVGITDFATVNTYHIRQKLSSIVNNQFAISHSLMGLL